MTVGEKIKYYRNIRGISQEMLGNLSGINPATIKKYEYGIRNPLPVPPSTAMSCGCATR